MSSHKLSFADSSCFDISCLALNSITDSCFWRGWSSVVLACVSRELHSSHSFCIISLGCPAAGLAGRPVCLRHAIGCCFGAGPFSLVDLRNPTQNRVLLLLMLQHSPCLASPAVLLPGDTHEHRSWNSYSKYLMRSARISNRLDPFRLAPRGVMGCGGDSIDLVHVFAVLPVIPCHLLLSFHSPRITACGVSSQFIVLSRLVSNQRTTHIPCLACTHL
jgi:hypothetical protein